MSELRAPDPTLSSLDPDEEVIVWPYYNAPSTAHRLYVGAHWELGDPYRGTACDSSSTDEVNLPAAAAMWFAVPCRACFPDAPPPGFDERRNVAPADRCDPDRDPGAVLVASAHLAWQTEVTP